MTNDSLFKNRLELLKQKLNSADTELAIISDDDSIYYFTGYYDYLHMDFGRPTLLVLDHEGQSTLITPSMEMDMAVAAANVDRVEFWNDGVGDEWRTLLPELLRTHRNVAIEKYKTPAIVLRTIQLLYSDAQHADGRLEDIAPMLDEMRMIKSPDELQLARHAGLVANAMMSAARETIASGVAEYEVALATSAAGTRVAAGLLETHYADKRMSPNIHFLQIMASGRDITMPHHRASTRRMKHGEAVFMCFCGMTNFHRFKLGFDRTFWIGEVADPSQIPVYETTLASQAAALSLVKSGVAAEDVHAAYADVIQSAGYEFPFRCGRATGFSFLEKPQLVAGEKTILQEGMVLAVDGCVSIAGQFRAQVGDSLIVTKNGYEMLTNHPKSLEDVIINHLPIP